MSGGAGGAADDEALRTWADAAIVSEKERVAKRPGRIQPRHLAGLFATGCIMG